MHIKYLPKHRRLDDKEKQVAKKFITLQANPKLLQQHLQHTTGKSVMLKDISNLKNDLRKQHGLGQGNLGDIGKQVITKERYFICTCVCIYK